MQRRYFHPQRLYSDDQQVCLAVGWTNNDKSAKNILFNSISFQGWESVGGLRKAIINVTLNISKTYFIIHFKRLSRSLCNLKTRKWQWNSWDKPIWSQTLKYHLQKFCECSLAIVCRILCEKKNSVLRVNKHSKMLLFF